MDTNIYDFLQLNEQELVDSLFDQLVKANAVHYQSSDRDELWKRCKRLAHEFIGSLPESPEVFARYIRKIAGDRISEGFHLREIQMALSIFEQEVWKRCASEVEERADLLKVLSMVSWTIGNAKDELARTYLEQMVRAEEAVRELKSRAMELFQGTESQALTGADF